METKTIKAVRYYVAVKPRTDEVHSVHREGCPFMPENDKRIFLGHFPSGNEAGEESRKYFTNSHGCRFCSKEDAIHHHAEFVPAGLSSVMALLN
ncbi:MAG TPA: hypothetical protein VK207_09200 [Bacteroidales bacterium]|nr:hypothetical protein [Bacteroidales bacterium]